MASSDCSVSITISGGSLCAGTWRLTNGCAWATTPGRAPPGSAAASARCPTRRRAPRGRRRPATGEDLERPEQQGPRRPGPAESAGERPVQHERQVGDEEQGVARPAQMGAGVPAARDREPGQARGRHRHEGGVGRRLSFGQQQCRDPGRSGQEDRTQQREDQSPAPGQRRSGRPAHRDGEQRDRGEDGSRQRTHEDCGQHRRPLSSRPGSHQRPRTKYPGRRRVMRERSWARRLGSAGLVSEPRQMRRSWQA